MAAPSANELYFSCMQAAGDLVARIGAAPPANFDEESLATTNRANAQAVLALVQSAVTIHAAARTAKTGRRD